MNRPVFYRRMTAVLFERDMAGLRFMLGMGEFFWGIGLLWPGDSFARPTYALMSHVMSEEAWGFLFLLSAATQWTIVVLADFESRFSNYFASWNAVLWGGVMFCCFGSVYPPPAAMGGDLACAFGAIWLAIRRRWM